MVLSFSQGSAGCFRSSFGHNSRSDAKALLIRGPAEVRSIVLELSLVVLVVELRVFTVRLNFPIGLRVEQMTEVDFIVGWVDAATVLLFHFFFYLNLLDLRQVLDLIVVGDVGVCQKLVSDAAKEEQQKNHQDRCGYRQQRDLDYVCCDQLRNLLKAPLLIVGGSLVDLFVV